MNSDKSDPRDPDSLERSNWCSSILNGLRRKLGASHRQFIVFGFLLLVVTALWARPAATLLWHRLRIITGMPRMALADDDPEEVVKAKSVTPEQLDAGRPVGLDEVLRRDPFKRRLSVISDQSSHTQTTGSATLPTMATERAERITSAATSILLSGTAKGLGTALLNGRARVVGDDFEVDEFSFRLMEVRTGVVVIEGAFPGQKPSYQFLLDRNGAQLIPGR